MTTESEDDSSVEDFVRRMFRSNYTAEPIGALRVASIRQCYPRGYGEGCAVGSVVFPHGFIDEIRESILPKVYPEAYRKADIIAHHFNEVVRLNQSHDGLVTGENRRCRDKCVNVNRA